MMMTGNENNDRDADRDEELAFLSRAIQFTDGALSASESVSFNEELRQSDAKLSLFAELQLQGTMVRSALRQAAYEQTDVPSESARSNRVAKILLTLAASTVLVVAAYWVGRAGQVVTEIATISNARLISKAKARFFDNFSPSIDSRLVLGREYVLTEGLVELAFPKGAMTIIESPSVFRIIADDCLAMDAGRCSVYAPKGAEGFRVETPTTRVVDKGTRFAVSVGENAATEVQMVEGAADVFRGSLQKQDIIAPIHLSDQEAMRFAGAKEIPGIAIPSMIRRYRRNLPDRIVGYQATGSTDGRVDQLKSVTVQRGGRLQVITVDEMIGVKLTQFRSGKDADVNGHFAAGSKLPSDRLSLLSDSKLNTGIINPGGSNISLSTAPGLETPGFEVQFARPVVNGPGPDVIFFELQCKTNSIDGDAFHVSPVEFSETSRSHTIWSYDLTLATRESLPISNFLLYRFSEPIASINDLKEMECNASPINLTFYAIAVGIDLSDLGFANGASVEALFFQDAADDEKSIVDPVFIAGLPPFKGEN